VTAVLDIVRLHLVDRRFVLGSLLTVPLFVALALGVAAVEVAATGSFGRGFATGIVAGFYGGAAAVQATSTSRLLPFAVAMGRTRREFHLGTLLFGLLLSLVLGALLHLALAVERLTGGWGAGLTFLGGGWEPVGHPLGQYLVLTAPFLLTFPLAVLASVVRVRWGTGWPAAAVVAGVVAAYGVLVGLDVLPVGARDAVPATALLVALGLVAAGAGWLAVRRAPV
jgi:hypothetical protein